MVNTFRGTSYDELLRATEENHAKFWLSLGLETQMAVQTTQVITGIPHPLLNLVLRAQFPIKESTHLIRSLINQFAERRLPFSWWVDRHSTPYKLGEQLQANGLSKLGVFPGMGLFLKDLEISSFYPKNFKIEPVNTPEKMQLWGSVMQNTFHLPDSIRESYVAIYNKKGFGPGQPFDHFLGSVDGKPIASSTLFIYEDIAGIYNLTVLPDSRGHGYATAMIMNLLFQAQLRQCRLSVLQSSSMMVNVYKRLGFFKLMEWQVYFSSGYTRFPPTSVLPQD